MKILLALFVLLFSSSVVAGDDLTGKKILCIGDYEEANVLENYSFDFLSRNIVKVNDSHPDESIGENELEYETHPKYIRINFISYIILRINRESLVLGKKYLHHDFIAIGTCKIIEGTGSELWKLLTDEIDKQVEEIKEGNII